MCSSQCSQNLASNSVWNIVGPQWILLNESTTLIWAPAYLPNLFSCHFLPCTSPCHNEVCIPQPCGFAHAATSVSNIFFPSSLPLIPLSDLLKLSLQDSVQDWPGTLSEVLLPCFPSTTAPHWTDLTCLFVYLHKLIYICPQTNTIFVDVSPILA